MVTKKKLRKQFWNYTKPANHDYPLEDGEQMVTRNRKKKKSKILHSNQLKSSILVGGSQSPVPMEMLEKVYPGLEQYSKQTDRQWDTSMLEAALIIQEKFKEVTQSYANKYGVSLPIPDDTKEDMLLWRTAFVRYRNGDFRHTEDERQAMARLAQWTVDEQMKLRNQDPVKVDMLNESI